jgi:hypothetical protein
MEIISVYKTAWMASYWKIDRRKNSPKAKYWFSRNIYNGSTDIILVRYPVTIDDVYQKTLDFVFGLIYVLRIIYIRMYIYEMYLQPPLSFLI